MLEKNPEDFHNKKHARIQKVLWEGSNFDNILFF